MVSLLGPRRRLRSTVSVLLGAVTVLATLITAPSAHAAPTPATRWVCNSAMPADPCDLPLDTTDPRSRVTITPRPVDETNKPIDCFYVYPTVNN